jgi:hypothetical protein
MTLPSAYYLKQKPSYIAPASQFLLVRNCPGGRGANLHQGLFHLLNDQADHLFRIFGLIEQGVDVGIDDVRHAGKNAHGLCLLDYWCRVPLYHT